MRWIQLVARFDPDAEGLSAFAAGLEHELGRPASGGTGVLALAGASDRPWSNLERLELAPEDRIILHYVGYGYSRRGAPIRLARAWERIRERVSGARCGVHFHEVAAFGPPWRSSFWFRPFQVAVARRLLAASEAAVTSLVGYQEWLRRLCPGRAVERIAVPSTIGEPSSVPGADDRPARLVVFGSEGVRARAYRTEARALARAVREAGVTEIADLGDGSVAPGEIAGVPVRPLGRLPRHEVSRELLGARFGFVAYPPDFLDKSTIYGAYLAHGLVPLCAWSGPRGRAPRAGEVWWRATPSRMEGTVACSIAASRAHAAYAERALARHGELWKRALEGE